jgi:hypothetical protein
MALQPIDLQTMFTQLDKVGKAQMEQKEGLALHQSLQNIQTQKKTEARIQSVEETKHTDKGAESINDRNARKRSHEQGAGADKKDHDRRDDETKPLVVVRDPSLGKNIDMSG